MGKASKQTRYYYLACALKLNSFLSENGEIRVYSESFSRLA